MRVLGFRTLSLVCAINQSGCDCRIEHITPVRPPTFTIHLDRVARADEKRVANAHLGVIAILKTSAPLAWVPGSEAGQSVVAKDVVVAGCDKRQYSRGNEVRARSTNGIGLHHEITWERVGYGRIYP